MSDLTDFLPTSSDGRDEDEYSDEVVTEWIRDGEERLNNELRVNEMIVREYATFDDNCAVLPADWLEHIYVRLKGGKPFHFCTPDEYWELPPASESLEQRYTTIGLTLFIWPPVDPDALTQVEIAYFRKITPIGDTRDAVFDRFPSIYRNVTLTAAAPYLIEDERLQTWAGLATAGITKANDAAHKARWSGSPLLARKRSFG
jgi:hypothetical protein